METLTHISIGVAITSFLGAAVAKAYLVGYSRGYTNGKHCGFSEGLWASARRRNKNNERQEFWVS